MNVFLIIGVIFASLGFLISIAAAIWMIVEMFKVSPGWGIAGIIGIFCASLPQLVFLIVHWKEAWRPFVASFGGIIPILVGGTIWLVEMSMTAAPPM